MSEMLFAFKCYLCVLLSVHIILKKKLFCYTVNPFIAINNIGMPVAHLGHYLHKENIVCKGGFQIPPLLN